MTKWDLGRDVSEKHFMTKSVSALHRIPPLYILTYCRMLQAPIQILK